MLMLSQSTHPQYAGAGKRADPRSFPRCPSLHYRDYPDFYKKLYALFDHEIFYVKYRDRFFHLANIFLHSPYVGHLTSLSLPVNHCKRHARSAPCAGMPLR